MRPAKGHFLEYAAIIAFAACAGGLLPVFGWLISVLAGFSFAALFYALAVAITLQRTMGDELALAAARHDRRAAFVLVSGLVIDFAALGLVLLFLTAPEKSVLAVGLAAISIFSAWALLNMLFAIHYAHVYFTARRPNGAHLEFPGEGERAFSDFVYFAFVIGMTFQVSDVSVTDAGMRRLVVAHSMLAFMFNVFVLALAVNAFGNIF